MKAKRIYVKPFFLKVAKARNLLHFCVNDVFSQMHEDRTILHYFL